jgi:hypothetical protein
LLYCSGLCPRGEPTQLIALLIKMLSTKLWAIPAHKLQRKIWVSWHALPYRGSMVTNGSAEHSAPLCLILKTEALRSSEMSVTIYQLVQRNIAEGLTIHQHSWYNWKSQNHALLRTGNQGRYVKSSLNGILKPSSGF